MKKLLLAVLEWIRLLFGVFLFFSITFACIAIALRITNGNIVVIGIASIIGLFIGGFALIYFMYFLKIPFLEKKPAGPILTHEERIKKLHDEGMVIGTDYNALRSFEIFESGDEGPHYFIELEDKTILYLNGQYLDDYQPDFELPVEEQSRIFPCTQFTIYKHKTEGWVTDIDCKGNAISLDGEYDFEEFDIDPPEFDWDDGNLIRNCTYDELIQSIIPIKKRKRGFFS